MKTNDLSKVLIGLVFILFLSCENENTYKIHEEQELNSSVEEGTFEDFSELPLILESLEIKNQNGKYVADKNGKNLEIKIDSNEIVRYKNGSVETYTFRVEIKKMVVKKAFLKTLYYAKTLTATVRSYYDTISRKII